ncbi:hypothetical protein [Synechococcus sp. CS-1328]|uniref:hypothetical protein n=1 Tax=Synechococcus sp. CS-1328 TaxID=2847976 RepID=UPI00223BC563|nr:hypothetical protein [Synechococcus sp. CS-1328]MCT0226456.1 hypothetical protein [Synechococcus sp. CS-1328]
MDSSVVDNGDGTSTVTLRSAPWNATLRPGESLTLRFNASSPEGFAVSGPLTGALLFGEGSPPSQPGAAQPGVFPAAEPVPSAGSLVHPARAAPGPHP